MSDKPTVTCEFVKLEEMPLMGIGVYRAHLRRTSVHPRLGPDREGQVTVTSQVLRVCFVCGVIETLNTFYVFK